MRWTLRTKWTLAVLAIGIVPLAVLGGVVLELQRSGLARAEKELEAAVVDEAATRVLVDLDATARTGARVGKLLGDESADVDARIGAIRELVAGPLTGVGIFDGERRFVDAVIAEGKDDPALHVAPARAGFEVLPDGRVRWAGPIEGAVEGWVVLAVSPGALDERLKDLSLVRFGAPDRVYLVDATRRPIAGRGRGEPLPIFERPMPTSFSAELVVTTELVDRGVPKVATLRTMPEQGWALVVERPTAEAFAALSRTRHALAVSLGAFTLLAAMAGLLVARRSLRPLGPLMDLVRRYAQREFRARSAVRSGDELEALGSSLEKMADDLAASETEIAKRARTEENLRRYLPAEAAEAAVNEGALDLGGAKRSVTVVFADVVAFTSFAERTPPDKAVAFLNELFTILSEVVFRHEGMVDKFIGDCIMAVFRGDDHCARALAAAEDMHAFVASNLPRWRSEYTFDVELGIGVATGEVLLGNLGSESRMEYTVIGDAVNVAARLEAIARPRQTLATREVKEACPAHRFTSLGEHALRGKAQPVEVFEVVT
ncbi:MAG: HAMP domain-containing protein [Labilithrix sp.]|nr:HAMP domain-containing protein [Labilithrix sp.]MCW5815628.1 HAMP domain-containing protein [Labilithrix sp.]